MTSLHFSTGPDDPRLYEVDDDFRQLLADLSPLIAASRMQRARVFHRTATAAGGTLRILDQPDLPAHGFFRPGRAFEVVKLCPEEGNPAYHVLLAPDGKHSCECKGFLRWNLCRHVLELAAA